ncbi:MAG: DMT family transporter [Rickettsiales bacterium]|nr:DMT family transporter [Rickettsiales bacterium]
MGKEISGIIFKILNILCIVLVGLANKWAMKDLSTFQTFFLSCLSSLIIVSTILRFQRKQSILANIKNIDKPFLCIAVINFTSFCTFLYALKLIDLNIITAIFYLTPVIASLLAILILKEKMSLKLALALSVSIIGTIIITKPLAETSFVITGVTVALISAIGWALHDLLLKRQAAIHWTQQSFRILFLCTIMSLPLAVITWQPLTYTHIKFVIILGLIYTVNKMLLIKALANARLVLLAPISYTKLIFTAISTYFLFNEVISFNTIIGSTLIIAATILIMYSTKKTTDMPIPQK